MDDLATSESINPTESSEIPPAYSGKPLTYEETPVVDPWASQPQSISSQEVPKQKRKQGSIAGFFGNLIFFILLFVIGIGLSMYFRQYLPAVPEGMPKANLPTLPKRFQTPTPVIDTTPEPTQVLSRWTSYEVLNGVTRKPVSGITFQLPSDVLEPICDGSSCGSQGTYLPGGTRFTVAPRGKGQILADFRGSIISDLQGQAFTTKTTTVAGRPAVEYSGVFTGSTVAGYAFSQMRGVMIEVNADLSLELNHFTPKGVDGDFQADDAVFDEIVKTLELSRPVLLPVTLEKGGVASSASGTPSPAVKNLKECLTYVNPCDSRSCDYDASKCGSAPR